MGVICTRLVLRRVATQASPHAAFKSKLPKTRGEFHEKTEPPKSAGCCQVSSWFANGAQRMDFTGLGFHKFVSRPDNAALCTGWYLVFSKLGPISGILRIWQIWQRHNLQRDPGFGEEPGCGELPVYVACAKGWVPACLVLCIGSFRKIGEP